MNFLPVVLKVMIVFSFPNSKFLYKLLSIGRANSLPYKPEDIYLLFRSRSELNAFLQAGADSTNTSSFQCANNAVAIGFKAGQTCFGIFSFQVWPVELDTLYTPDCSLVAQTK